MGGGGSQKRTPKERLTGQNRGGRRVGEEPFLFACPSPLRFSVAFMMAASINVPPGRAFVKKNALQANNDILQEAT